MFHRSTILSTYRGSVDFSGGIPRWMPIDWTVSSWSFGLLALVALLSWSETAAGQVQHPELEQRYQDVVQFRGQILKERARYQLTDLEHAVLNEYLEQSQSIKAEPVPRALPVIRENWLRSLAERNAEIQQFASAKSTESHAALADWERIQHSEIRFREYVRDIESRLGMDLGDELAFSGFSLALWLGPSIALLLLISWLLRRHELKVADRKRLRSQTTGWTLFWLLFGLSTTAGIAVCLPIAWLLQTNRQQFTPQATWLARQIDDLDRLQSQLKVELQQMQEQREHREAERTNLQNQAREHWERLLGDKVDAAPSALVRAVLGRESEGLAQLQTALLGEAQQNLFRQDAATVLEDLKGREQVLQSFVQQYHTQTLWISAIALGSTVVSLVGCSAFYLLARRKSRQRWNANRQTCPRCLEAGKLTRKGSKVQCNGCQGRFPPSILEYDRLCFPTVGVRGSGKTHWIMEFFDEVRRSGISVDADMRLVKSGSEVESKFDSMLELQRGGETWKGTEGTLHEADRIPEPILFSVQDRDWMLPRNDLSLLIFDLSGEVMNADVDLDKLRARALKMDGFLLFLDPRQVKDDSKATASGKSPWLKMQDQLNKVIELNRDMKTQRDLEENSRLNVPIAVCVSKLDLIPKYNPLGERGHELLDRLRETENEPTTLELIQKRSDIVADYMQLLFDGWNVKQEMKSNFGAQFLFFPLTPVNILDHEIRQGIDDLKDRSLKPFGIQEPVLWLLHVNGYRVLK